MLEVLVEEANSILWSLELQKNCISQRLNLNILSTGAFFNIFNKFPLGRFGHGNILGKFSDELEEVEVHLRRSCGVSKQTQNRLSEFPDVRISHKGLDNSHQEHQTSLHLPINLQQHRHIQVAHPHHELFGAAFGEGLRLFLLMEKYQRYKVDGGHDESELVRVVLVLQLTQNCDQFGEVA